MLFAASVLAAALMQQPAAPAPELPVLDARLGACAADFTVTDADGKPVYNATIRVRIRYGFMSVKRMDLEVGTNSDGKARVAGLPAKAKPLAYEIVKDDKKAAAEQDVASTCKANHVIALK
jgi:hypothetical protein